MNGDVIDSKVRSCFFKTCLAACHRISDIHEKRQDQYDTIEARCNHCHQMLSLTYNRARKFSNQLQLTFRTTLHGTIVGTPHHFTYPWDELDPELIFCPKLLAMK